MDQEINLASLSRAEKIDLYFALIEDEQKRRKEPDQTSPFAHYIDNPVGFIQDTSGEFLWSKQREIAEAVRDHTRVAVKSCHSAGKSYTTARIGGWFLSVHKPGDAFLVTTAPTFTQVKSILWREINRFHRLGKLPGYTNQTEWHLNGELVGLGRKPDDTSPTAFQGLHARYLLALIDEACGVNSAMVTAIETLVSNDDGKILAIGNPDDPNTEFGRMCQTIGSEWHVITVSAFDTPNFTGEDVPDDIKSRLIGKSWVETRKKKWGEDSALYKSKVLGEFPDVSDDTLIPLNWITAAVATSLEPEEGDPNELGVDCARYGRNESVIYHRHGPRFRLHDTSRKRDLMTLTGMIVKAVVDTGATVVKIDDAGLGGGVTDRLQEIKREKRDNPLRRCTIVPVNVSWSATERVVERIGGTEIQAKQRFYRLKSEICWQLRDLFQSGQIDLDDDEDTQLQTSQIKYWLNSKGLICIESKDELEERLKQLEGITGQSGSPDRFDALCLAAADVPMSKGLYVDPEVLMKAQLAQTMIGGKSTAPRGQVTSTSLHISEAILRRARGEG